ncbi:MAG: hypothetical protein QGF00_10535 [Planctomycetota bacterium]|jgi:serine/threonine protein kinase|nr:hypothetical protein [Planctomycetota bacterium]MDP7250029.1 hypothetical protein [Planctomycetota bacterium]
MAIKIRCNNPECRTVIDCPEESAGQVIECEQCGKKLKVPARTLGEYKIVRELGKGGMGSVYEAIQTKLNRQVASTGISSPITSC